MENVSKLLERVIVECECDSRIESGVFDVYSAEHLVVLSEHMVGYGISESVVEDVIESMAIGEGKYPERQAYNKEGWLVTFPSKEYRDAAINKKTHYSSDPTHGQGGMNLYYKRKGKQKRQQSQVTTTTQQLDQQPSGTAVNSRTQTAAQQKDNTTGGQSTDSQPTSVKKDTGTASNSRAGAQPKPSTPPTPAAGAAKSQSPSNTDASASPTAPKPSDVPTINVPVVTQPPEQYASISKKFAIQKGWTPEPYNEYRDSQGNAVAVVGLSGEVVPIKNTDREEYKLFAEKNIPQA
jgi:hypothetical protein